MDLAQKRLAENLIELRLAPLIIRIRSTNICFQCVRNTNNKLNKMMSYQKLMEEEMREAACFGDIETLKDLVLKDVNINSKNNMNGWTALHWAAFRGNFEAVSILLNHGADPKSLNFNDELPGDLTTSEEIQALLGGKLSGANIPPLPIVPNYLKNPLFFYSFKNNSKKDFSSQSKVCSEEGLILKIRIAESLETDFIEIELQRSELTIEKLKEICCKELDIEPHTVCKIRKLPNTIVRNNNDVQRLSNFQELEICQTRT